MQPEMQPAGRSLSQGERRPARSSSGTDPPPPGKRRRDDPAAAGGGGHGVAGDPRPQIESPPSRCSASGFRRHRAAIAQASCALSFSGLRGVHRLVGRSYFQRRPPLRSGVGQGAGQGVLGTLPVLLAVALDGRLGRGGGRLRVRFDGEEAGFAAVTGGANAFYRWFGGFVCRLRGGRYPGFGGKSVGFADRNHDTGVRMRQDSAVPQRCGCGRGEASHGL